ncbi:hypothetical protein HYX70_04065 [Candidatus Saccharibacteria bacterium]|nr:hypothetical protein [Candidatus Saccharibacteria bacterium]
MILKRLLRLKNRPRNPQKRIIGYNQYLKSNYDKRVLVSYLVPPVLDELESRPTPLFSNNGAGRTIPKVLNQLGYVVDVINWDDTGPIEGEYDIVIYHGGKNFANIEKLKSADNKLVYYSTGSYWKYHNSQEERRAEYFKQRHNMEYKLDRKIADSEELANKNADAIIVLGNRDAAKTYSGFKDVYNLEGASMSIKNPRKILETKSGKLGFLFMAGPGNLHKGLDIILDAWQKLPNNFELHIITYLDGEFTSIYKDVLYNTPNIHTHGYVLQRSSEYYEAIKDCQFSILMSCSEGSPGSAIESLHQGLIPVLSKESHVDVDGHGYTLKDDRVETLVDLLNTINKLTSREIKSKQEKTRLWAEKKFTIKHYEDRLKEIIEEVTK